MEDVSALPSNAVRVEGYTEGSQRYASHKGTVLGDYKIPAICVEDTVDNLFSLPDIANAGGSFYGDADGLIVFKSKQPVYKHADAILVFTRDTDGLWACPPSSISHQKALNTRSDRYFSAEERKRAKLFREMHETLGHPSDDALINGLHTGSFLNCSVTAQDAYNAQHIFGACDACLIGKMTAPTAPTSQSQPATSIGDVIHVDPVSYDEITIGGNKACLISVDERSDFVVGVNLKRESTDHVSQGLTEIISVYNAHGHKVNSVLSDHGSNLVASAVNLGLLGVRMNTTVPGQHSKRVERKIRTLKARERAVLASLPYKLPANLYGELRANVIATLNLLPTTSTGNNVSPSELFTGKKTDLAIISKAPFGTAAIFYRYDHANSFEPRAEYGIIVGWHRGAKNAVRAFIPARNKVFIKQKFTVIDAIPPEWGWTSQVPARSYRLPPRLSGNNTAVQSFVDDYTSTLDHDNYDASFVNPADSSFSDASPVVNLFHQESVLPVHHENQTMAADEDVLMDDSDVRIEVNAGTGDRMEVPEIENSLENIASRRSSRIRNTFVGEGNSNGNEYSKFAANMTVHCNRKLHALEADRAIRLEFTSLREDMDAVVPVAFTSIDTSAGDSIIPSHMLVNDKYKPDGTYDKTKARLCAGGNWLDPATYGDTSSKTTNGITANILLKIAAAADEDICIYDIKSAFVHARMEPDAKKIFVKLAPSMSKIYCDLYPNSKQFLHDNSLYLQLRAYLYGLPQASLMFQQHLVGFLVRLGFSQSVVDECLFTKRIDADNYMRIAVHVDDMLVTGRGSTLFDELNCALQQSFVGYSCQRGDRLSYLGQTLIRNRLKRELRISQLASIEDLLERSGMADAKEEDMPYSTTLLLPDTSTEYADREEFLSLVMSLLYIAQKSRYDIYFIVVYLATKSAHPTKKDWEAAKRVLRYLKFTKHYELIFSGDDVTVSILADASHALHTDMKGHSGIEIRMGNDVIYCQSGKQKANTISSTESEVLCLRDAVTYVPYLIQMFKELGVPIDCPVKIGQDNTAVIEWCTHGAKFKRAKHILVAIYFIKDFIDKSTAVLEHVRTEDMHADLLTKPVPADIFHPFVNETYHVNG